jgi:hypothetical protein
VFHSFLALIKLVMGGVNSQLIEGGIKAPSRWVGVMPLLFIGVLMRGFEGH